MLNRIAEGVNGRATRLLTMAVFGMGAVFASPTCTNSGTVGVTCNTPIIYRSTLDWGVTLSPQAGAASPIHTLGAFRSADGWAASTANADLAVAVSANRTGANPGGLSSSVSKNAPSVQFFGKTQGYVQLRTPYNGGGPGSGYASDSQDDLLVIDQMQDLGSTLTLNFSQGTTYSGATPFAGISALGFYVSNDMNERRAGSGLLFGVIMRAFDQNHNEIASTWLQDGLGGTCVGLYQTALGTGAADRACNSDTESLPGVASLPGYSNLSSAPYLAIRVAGSIIASVEIAFEYVAPSNPLSNADKARRRIYLSDLQMDYGDTAPPVPEPAVSFLVGAGILALGVLRRRVRTR